MFIQAEHYLLLPLTIPDELIVQEINVGLGRGKTRANLGIVVVYGVRDNLVLTYDSPGATFCNQPWSELFQRTGIEPAELWLPEHVRVLNIIPKSAIYSTHMLCIATRK